MGAANGSNTVFTLLHTPWHPANLVLWRDNFVVPQVAGAGGYAVSGATITMGTAPATGQNLYAFYYW